VVLAAGTLLAYVQVLGHDFTNYDDDAYVTRNWAVRQGLTSETLGWAFTAFHSANWHPLTWLSHALDVTVFGLNPAGHHAMSVVFHTIAASLLYLLFWRMTGAVWRSALVAALFAWHPLRVESVAWIAERKDVLSACFGFLTLLAYDRYVKRPALSWGIAVLVFFSLGLMAKPMLVTIPFVMLLLDFWPYRRISFSQSPTKFRRSAARLALEKAPLLPFLVASSILTVQAQHPASLEAIPFLTRLSNAAVSYAAYLVKTVYPYPLATPYPYDAAALTPFTVVVSCAVLLVVTAGAWRGRERAPYLLVGWLWYLGMSVPVIGLVQVGNQALADRYTYLPLIGVFLAAVWGLGALADRGPVPRASVRTLAVVALAVFLGLTVLQTRHWRNTETLFTHTLMVSEDEPVSHNNLGLYLLEKGRDKEALEHFKAAIALMPGHLEARNNLAAAHIKLGNLDEARKMLVELLRINPHNPSALTNMAIVLHSNGDIEGARRFAGRALELDPRFERARRFLIRISGDPTR
jgi:tetratricopeptide (TPR) repeat protein